MHRVIALLTVASSVFLLNIILLTLSLFTCQRVYAHPLQSKHTVDYTNPRALLNNGSIGFAPTVQSQGIRVAHGDQMPTITYKIIPDPINTNAGLILSPRAANALTTTIHIKRQYLGQELSPQERFESALLAILGVQSEVNRMSEAEIESLVEQHFATKNHILFPGSPFVSTSGNEATTASFAYGIHNNPGQVYQGYVNPANMYAAPLNYQKSLRDDSWLEQGEPMPLDITGNKIAPVPLAELLLSGGFYYRNTISIDTALRQAPKTMCSILDLKALGLQGHFPSAEAVALLNGFFLNQDVWETYAPTYRLKGPRDYFPPDKNGDSKHDQE